MTKPFFYFAVFLVIISLTASVYFLWDRYGMFDLFAESKEAANASGNSLFSQASDAVKNLFSRYSDGNDNFKLVKQIPLEDQREKPSLAGSSRLVNKSQEFLQSQIARPVFPICAFNTIKTPLRQDVIISEIAWMGGVNSANNEWIELKNISDKAVDVSGWQLTDKDEQIKVIFPADTKIKPGSFFVLERNEEAIPNINADYLYTGNLRNSDEGLRLFDRNCGLVDEVLAEKSWPAGDNQTKKTMERNASDLSWYTSNLGGGTPNKENSMPPRVEFPNVNLNSQNVTSSVVSSSAISSTTPTTSSLILSVNSETSAISSTTTVATSTTMTVCSQENLGAPSHLVLINEVAWAGGSSANGLGSADEWIELKNVSGQPINLNGWRLLNKSANIEINFSDKDILSSGAFYLLERTDDDSVPNTIADKFFTNAILNSAESLRLFDSNCQLIDEIIANPDWSAGNSSEYRTTERLSDLSWQTYSGSGENGILGTPKKENSIPGSSGGGSTPPLSPPPSPPPPSSPSSNIVISEIMYDLPGADSDREWIEILNSDGIAINLEGWKFFENETNHGLALIQGLSNLQPNERAIIADDSSKFMEDHPQYSGILFDSSFSLNNTGESLSIKNGDIIIDQVNYSSSWGANGDGNSLQLINSQWQAASPTPGE